MPRNGSDPRDIAVGKRARAFRIKAKLSQEAVGKKLGLTFQQIQKYESGVNRIAPSRLDEMAKMFKVPVGAFFGDGKDSDQDIGLIKNRSRANILVKLDRLDSPKIEQRISELLDDLVALRK